MKKVLISLAMLLGLVACQNDFQSVDVDVNGEAALTLTVGLPADATRAAGVNSAEGALTNINLDEYDIRFILEVYDAAGNLAKERITNYEDDATTTVFDLRLVPGREYNFVAWADFVKEDQTGDYHYTTTDGLTNVEVNAATWTAMDESRDAYTGVKNIKEFKSTSAINFELKRPFAKLRVVTTDIKELYGDLLPEDVIVKYNTKLFTAYNALSTEATVAEFPTTKVVKLSEKAYSNETPKSTGVMTLFADYMLAETEASPIQFTMDVVDNKGVAIPTIVFNTAIPIQRNYLTTITGPILTDSNNITVTINDAFDNEHNIEDEPYYVEIWDGKSTSEPKHNGTTIADATEIYIEKGSELAWLADAVNGVTRADAMTFKNKTVKLEYDVDLGNNEWTPIAATGSFEGTFDGNEKTISNLFVSEDGTASAGLFANCLGTIKNVNVKGAKIYGHYKAGVIVGNATCTNIENCHVDGAVVVSTPYEKDNANHVGGIAGYLVADGGDAYIKDCSVKNAEISAYRDVAGITGTANKAVVVTGNTVENVTIISDQTVEYVKETYDGNAGEIVGRYVSTTNATIDNNTVGKDVKVIRKVNSNEELSAAIADAKRGDVITLKGTMTAPSNVNGLVFEGLEGAVLNNITTQGYYNDVTFRNLTLEKSNEGYQGFQHSSNLRYEGCTLNGVFFLYATSVFEKCTFNVVGDAYNVWTYGSTNAVFNKCTFNCDGKAALIYNENHNGSEVTFNNCVFDSKGNSFEGKAAIEIDSSLLTGDKEYVVNINNCTVNGFAEGSVSNDKLFNPKKGEKATIYVNGLKWSKDGYTDENGNESFQATTNEDFTAAIAEIPAGETGTISLYAGEYTFPASKLHEGITVNCAEGTVFTGSSSLNANGATIIGAAFENESGRAASGTIEGTFKNCVFGGADGLRYCYASDECVFVDCYFKENGNGEGYVFHVDSKATGAINPEITFIRCTFDGRKVAIGGAVENVIMEDCKLINGSFFNVYNHATITGTEFDTSIRPLGGHVTYTNCTYKGANLQFSDLKTYSGYDCLVTVDDKDYAVVSAAANFTKFVEEAERDIHVYMMAHIFDEVTILQKANVDVFVAGNSKTLRNLHIHGNARHDGAETLTIDNVHFSAFSDRDLIYADKTGSVERYAHNITIQNCSFEGDDNVVVVGMRLRQAYNVTIKDCTTKKLHSLGQITSVDGLTVDNVTINGLTGINLLTSCKNVNIKNSTINATEADGFAIRMDAGNANTVNVENSTFTAYEPIVFRSASANFKFNLVGKNTLNKGGDYHIVVKSGVCPTLSGAEGLDIKLP